MTEKQPDLFNILVRSSEEDWTWYVLIEHSKLKSILKKHLPQDSLTTLTQESTYEKTTVPNVLLYESGYKEWLERWRQIGNKEWWKLGREDIKKKTLKLKKLREKTLRKRKWCSYEEERCMLTIINDLETLLSPKD